MEQAIDFLFNNNQENKIQIPSDLFEAINYPNKIKNDKTILDGENLDIVIPDKKIAIEFNELDKHTELKGKGKRYHLNKTIKCEKKGYQLLHVFENEWILKPQIVLSIIHSKIGVFDKRIYARNCEVKEINYKTTEHFLNNNHLQGADNSKVRLALYHKGEIVSMMTFGKSRYNKKYEWEILRFANKINHQVIGGASKLLKYFIRKYKPNSIITYADRRYSNGNLYKKLGFKMDGVTDPNYFYIEGLNLSSRVKFQKHKLKNKLEKFDPNLTEWENMQLNGYDRIWDCGNYRFVWKKEEK